LGLICCGRVRFEGDDQKDQFEDVDHNKTEDAETVKSVHGLPHGVLGVCFIPHGNLHQQEEEVDDEQDDGCSGDLG
jgi:hypothetical protein